MYPFLMLAGVWPRRGCGAKGEGLWAMVSPLGRRFIPHGVRCGKPGCTTWMWCASTFIFVFLSWCFAFVRIVAAAAKRGGDDTLALIFTALPQAGILRQAV